jgi:hypothetical protein
VAGYRGIEWGNGNAEFGINKEGKNYDSKLTLPYSEIQI